MARFLVAAAWVYEGLWAKVLEGEPAQGRILAGLPGVGERRARSARLLLGTMEAAAALWVLAGRAPRATALAQTAVVAAMGGAARRWAREEVTNRRALTLQHAAFLTLVWLAARDVRP
jgi:DoxX-like family